ncbi:hypothetical protein K2173_008660 [Erythroxylum novogranatense]|uniref:Uncharacterized protein n=1 Tax=Erythroxylum novogranatense TaxID=1862640 RepID=A0AAV8SLY9_9ROSI|nr:hypothetical protein K2173_008660 [Erythroxylum novogranatense]
MFGRGGRGMGGGGGSSLMRVVGRTVTRAGVTNIQEPISGTAAATSPRSTHKPSSNNNNLSLCSGSGSGSSFSASGVPLHGYSRGSNPSYWPSVVGGACCDEYEWVSGYVSEEEIEYGVVDDFLLGPVPSADEVHHAVSALKSVVKDKFSYDVEKETEDEISVRTGLLHRVPSAGSEFGWIEPSMHLCNSRALNPHGPSRVYDAFHMLQNDPAVQKMVISLSSDKTVWDAVLNNEVVQELRKAHSSADTISSANTECNPAMNVVERIFENTKAGVIGVVEKILQLVNQLFKPHDEKKTTAGSSSPFEEKLRSSFLLSVVVLLIVIGTRARGA